MKSYKGKQILSFDWVLISVDHLSDHRDHQFDYITPTLVGVVYVTSGVNEVNGFANFAPPLVSVVI